MTVAVAVGVRPRPAATRSATPRAEVVMPGARSTVTLVDCFGPTGAELRIRKCLGGRMTLAQHEALALKDLFLQYRNELASAGWLIPALHDCAAGPAGTGWAIHSEEDFIAGGDGARLMSSGQPWAAKVALLRRIVDLMSGYRVVHSAHAVWGGVRMAVLPHGLDLKPSNVVLRGDDLFLVDHFLPMIRHGDLSRDVAPARESLVCGTRQGALLRFFRLAEWALLERGGDGRSAVARLRAEMVGLVRAAPLPSAERRYVQDQIVTGYPVLDAMYR